MDQGTPSNFYLTVCLYVSFYFLFFTSATPHLVLNNIPTEQELHNNRRAKTFSEQLDPFLAATRHAHATQQVKGIAKARAKATVGTVRGYHSRQHSKNPSSSSTASRSIGTSSSRTHSRQHSRQKSTHNRHQDHPSSANDLPLPGNYFAGPSSSSSSHTLTDPPPSNSPAHHDFQLAQRRHGRERTGPYHQQSSLQQLQQQYHLAQDPSLSSLHPQNYTPPQPRPYQARISKFPRANQNRYYHFYPEDKSLFRTKMDSAVTQTSIASSGMPSPKSNPASTLPQTSPIPGAHNHPNMYKFNNINNTSSNNSNNNSNRDQRKNRSKGPSKGKGLRSVPRRPVALGHESVTPSTLLAHLRLLRLVQSLVIVDDEDLDFLFLIRSEERYLMYLDMLQQLQPPSHSVPLPPLDVALMWTVHMLAPYRYYEDLLRSYSPHLLNYSFPLERYVASVDIEDPTTKHEAFRSSKEMWRQLYPEEAFDLDKNDTNRMFEIQCLWCGGTNVMDSSTYIKFRIDGMPIDCAGGSLLSPYSGTPDVLTAQNEHRHLFFHPRIQFGLDQSSASLNCSWPKVIEAFQDLGPDQYYGIRPTTLARIMSSYMGLVEERLSIDLVAGALRQRDFQKAMMITGGQAWCQPQVLQRTLERYKKFMLLARAESKHSGGKSAPVAIVGGGHPGAVDVTAGEVTTAFSSGGMSVGGQPGRHALVPTLDIDLAWHTHMLSPPHYRQYQILHYGRVLNHDDTVQATSTMTKQDFVRTAELWQELYQERYSSQEISWRGQFVLTPEKLCAGVCFPPYGVYLIWRSWRSKRRAKRLNRVGKESKDKERQRRDSDADMNEKGSTSSSSARASVDNHRQKAVASLSEKNPELQIEELSVTPENDSDVEVHAGQASGHDTKGKGRVENGGGAVVTDSQAPIAEAAMQGQGGSQQQQPSQSHHKNLTPALGLDGRLSNWNGDTAGPDGQASCSSGACVMSPWNELQDLVPYADIQPQQQRELRRERT
ncbi:hypothetical protein BGZ70_008748 [Mortierella alpina]|uniref:Uncharacterized protein n=1 Tax=Mortierella alpina TaxID=64518 RepID=A0A9P6M147_MORAP|nr:hypothetical protein BGZ70_008748 [Mortierella alpina]